nr:hypothetical protein [Burkholderia pseudomallei]
MIGTLIKVSGLDVALGELCELRTREGRLLQRAEVVGFTRDVALLSPFSQLEQISRTTQVIGLGRPLSIPVGDALLGRVIDGLGEPLDGGPPLASETLQPLIAAPPEPMSRRMIDAAMPTGVRVVDAMMALGRASAWVSSRRRGSARARCWACSRAAPRAMSTLSR